METYWSLSESIARLTVPAITGEVAVLYPWRGFSPALSKQANVGLLKVITRATQHDAPETLVDCYQRGVDLIATYAQTPERTVRPQVYWRYLNAGEVSGVELILSAQTSLLDSQPLTSVESTLPVGDVLAISSSGELSSPAWTGDWQTGASAPVGVLFRPRDWQVSYLELIHPSDLAAVQLTQQAGLPSVRWQLFPERLEKGVVRRGRVRGLFLPRAQDEALTKAALASFADSPLVLST